MNVPSAFIVTAPIDGSVATVKIDPGGNVSPSDASPITGVFITVVIESSAAISAAGVITIVSLATRD